MSDNVRFVENLQFFVGCNYLKAQLYKYKKNKFKGC